MYSALGAEEFPRRDNFATRTERKTHERYGKDASIDRETIAKLSQNSLTHADKARPSTSNALRAVRLNTSTTSDRRTHSLYSIRMYWGGGKGVGHRRDLAFRANLGSDFKRP